MHHVCHAVDRMGEARVRFKCANAVRLCAARGICVGYETHSHVVSGHVHRRLEKTQSFSFCQVDMYESPEFRSAEPILITLHPYDTGGLAFKHGRTSKPSDCHHFNGRQGAAFTELALPRRLRGRAR